MIQGTKSESNGKIRIEVPQITEENCSFSILVDIPNENEKFVISNKVDIEVVPTDIPSDNITDTQSPDNTSDNTSDDNDDSLILKIVIPIACVILVIGIVFLILYIRKRRGSELKQSILKTSFNEGDSKEQALMEYN